MKAGPLRDRVTLQVLSKTPGSRGQLRDSWADDVTLWARVRTPTGREAVISGQLQAQLTHVLEIRYPGATTAAKVNANNRFTWGGRVLGITSARPDERRREMFIDCSEVVPKTAPTYPAAGGG